MHCLQNINEPQNQYVFLLLFYIHKMHLLALLGLFFYRQMDVCKTWTTSVDLVHGPRRGPGPWTTPVEHP